MHGTHSIKYMNYIVEESRKLKLRNIYMFNINIYLTFWMSVVLILTPRSRIFIEKVTGPQLVKKLAAFYETQRFVTAFTTAC